MSRKDDHKMLEHLKSEVNRLMSDKADLNILMKVANDAIERLEQQVARLKVEVYDAQHAYDRN